MKITTVGIDLAKNVFGIHGANEKGRVVVRKVLSRRRMLEFLANLTKCLLGMEACASAQYWAREIAKLGHEVRLIAPRASSVLRPLKA
jgi:transposase